MKSAKLNLFVWIIVSLLVIIAVVANYYFANLSNIIRLTAWVLFACFVGFLVLQTSQGQAMWQFIREARVELRKVVWPTRQETVQTTIAVLLMVVAVSLFLWGVDSTLLWAVAFLTGQRG